MTDSRRDILTAQFEELCAGLAHDPDPTRRTLGTLGLLHLDMREQMLSEADIRRAAGEAAGEAVRDHARDCLRLHPPAPTTPREAILALVARSPMAAAVIVAAVILRGGLAALVGLLGVA